MWGLLGRVVKALPGIGQGVKTAFSGASKFVSTLKSEGLGSALSKSGNSIITFGKNLIGLNGKSAFKSSLHTGAALVGDAVLLDTGVSMLGGPSNIIPSAMNGLGTLTSDAGKIMQLPLKAIGGAGSVLEYSGEGMQSLSRTLQGESSVQTMDITHRVQGIQGYDLDSLGLVDKESTVNETNVASAGDLSHAAILDEHTIRLAGSNVTVDLNSYSQMVEKMQSMNPDTQEYEALNDIVSKLTPRIQESFRDLENQMNSGSNQEAEDSMFGKVIDTFKDWVESAARTVGHFFGADTAAQADAAAAQKLDNICYNTPDAEQASMEMQ